MKISIKNIAFYISLIFLMGCDEDRFSQVLEIELPEETPVLAVTSGAQAGDSTLSVFVSHTLGALEDPNFEAFPDATVRLFENGTILSELQYDLEKQKHFAVLPTPIKETAGTTYRLEVNADGYESVFAEQTMPTIVPVLSAAYSSKSAIDFEGEEVDELAVVFNDPSGEENFYSFQALYIEKYVIDTDTFENWQFLYLDSIDPLLEEIGGGYMINDRSFSGGQYTANFFFFPINSYGGSSLEVISKTINIRLTNLTKDRYLYLKTLLAYQDNKDNPFAEPVTVHHNFENGTGIFMLGSFSEFVLEIEE